MRTPAPLLPLLLLAVLLGGCDSATRSLQGQSPNERACPGWTFLPDDVLWVEMEGVTADPRAVAGQRTMHQLDWTEDDPSVLVRAGDGWRLGEGEGPPKRGAVAWMTWEVDVERSQVRALIEAAVSDLRCLGPAPPDSAAPPPARGVVVRLGSTPSVPSVKLHQGEDGGWTVVRDGVPARWSARDEGFGAALVRFNESVSGPGRQQWALHSESCALPLSPKTRPTAVDVTLRWSGLGPGSKTQLSLKGEGGGYGFEALQVRGVPSESRRWTGSLPGTIARPLVALLVDGVRCGEAPRVMSHTDDYPRRSVRLRFADPPWMVAVSSESQGPGGAPWEVSSRSGATVRQGARDDGAIQDAIRALIEATEATAPSFAPAPDRMIQRR